ncbi:MAG TPA: glycosyltransferase family 4 protein [Polyangiaceae bacterium]|nr:glycosyltransferase family 4 protein [Polyangiaceae bacterium]
MTIISERISPLGIFVSYASGCLTDYMPHGDGLICFSILDGLARRGHEVFACTPYSAIRVSSPRLQVSLLERVIPADSLAGWEGLWRARQLLKQLVRSERIDVTWRMHPYGEGCPGKPPTLGRPLIIGPLFRGWPPEAGASDPPLPRRFGFRIGKYLQPLARRGWDRAMGSAGLILCATPNHAREVRRAYPKAKVIVTPVMVDPPSETQPRVRWNGQGPFRLVFVANLVRGKNARLFCEVVAELRRRGADVRGTLIGEGSERAAIEELIAASGLAEHICLLGQVSNADVFDHLRASHLLLSASVGEPYGRGIAEAMAVGTPAVCHRSGGPSEFVTHDQDGLLIDEMSAAAYATAILRVVASPSSWESLAEGALRTAARWKSEVVLETIEEALVGLLRGRVSG